MGIEIGLIATSIYTMTHFNLQSHSIENKTNVADVV